jgi:hypothetical protein
MVEAKDLAQVRRNRGQSTGTAKGWNVKRPAMEGLDGLEAYYNQFRKDVHYNAYLAVEAELFAHEWEGL